MPEVFRQRLDRLHHDIVQQGLRVVAHVERAFEAVFAADREKAQQVIRDDSHIDRVDIEIEKAAVDLLAIEETDAKQLRLVLTIVKVNNELERIADLATDAAEQVVLVSGSGTGLHAVQEVGLPARHGVVGLEAQPPARATESLPPTLRVMVNSVIGMLRDSNIAMRDLDVRLARIVLASDDLVDEFGRTLLREVQERLAAGQCSVDYASAFWTIGNSLERMADHTTNIAEQVIYVETGQIVRHSSEGWSEPMTL